jgi:hypothetical protein
MSGDGFHVHGPHDHELEHAAHGRDEFSARIAVMTAILSTLGALYSYEAGSTQNSSLLFKNEAAIHKTAASNQWNYYQAKSSKQNLAEVAASLASGETAERYRQEAARYKQEKDDIKKEAERLESLSQEADHRSEEILHRHHRWAQAMTMVQIAISLSAITLLTRRRWLQVGAYLSGGVGLVLASLALMGV